MEQLRKSVEELIGQMLCSSGFILLVAMLDQTVWKAIVVTSNDKLRLFEGDVGSDYENALLKLKTNLEDYIAMEQEMMV